VPRASAAQITHLLSTLPTILISPLTPRIGTYLVMLRPPGPREARPEDKLHVRSTQLARVRARMISRSSSEAIAHEKPRGERLGAAPSRSMTSVFLCGRQGTKWRKTRLREDFAGQAGCCTGVYATARAFARDRGAQHDKWGFHTASSAWGTYGKPR